MNISIKKLLSNKPTIKQLIKSGQDYVSTKFYDSATFYNKHILYLGRKMPGSKPAIRDILGARSAISGKIYDSNMTFDKNLAYVGGISSVTKPSIKKVEV